MCIFVKKKMRLFLGLLFIFASSCSVYKEKCDGVTNKKIFSEDPIVTKGC